MFSSDIEFLVQIAAIVAGIFTALYTIITAIILYDTNRNHRVLVEEQRAARREGYLFELVSAWNGIEMMRARTFIYDLTDQAKNTDLRTFLVRAGRGEEWYKVALVAHFIVRVASCMENGMVSRTDALREFTFFSWWARELHTAYLTMPLDARVVASLEYVMASFPPPPDDRAPAPLGNNGAP